MKVSRRKKDKKMTNNLITFVIFFSLLFKCICAEYRTLDGTNNNLNNPLPKTLSRENPPISFYSAINVASSALIPTPGNYTSLVPTDFGICSSSNNLPDDLYPLPRCVSNLVGSMRTDANDIYNLDTLGKFKSKRKISHMTTFFGFFMVADVIAGSFGGDNYPTGIYIPRDDQLYLSNSSSNPNLAILSPALPFNRSDSTPDSAGANLNSPFVDASQIYGLTPDQLSQLRDYNENRGRMLLIKSNDTSDSALGYPPKDANGEYIFGHIAKKGRNLFTDMFYVIFLREHNRRCDQLWDIYGDSWSDETYFQECRKWVIGLLQRVTFYEYLGIVLGSPLPTYKGYNPNLDPRIDTFFSTVTYRYGHSELSDYYYIVDEKGNTLATLPLNLIQVPQVEAYGAHTLASSLALQWQEEIDIYFADTVRKFPVRYQNQEIDIASLDVVRSRDHAIPLYNDAREAMGLKRAVEWSDITSDVDAQQRLIDTYRDINRVEAYIGGLAENHVNGSEFGELFYTSFYNQWMKIRDSDRFWYESNDAGYTKEEQEEINNTTLSQIIARNIPDNYQLPPDLWIVQPPISSDDPNNKENDPLSDYPPLNQVILSDVYKIYWKIVDDEIYFQLTMASTDAWFGIGFNDKDSMITSDMLIFRNTNDNNIEARRYQADGYYTPKLISDQDDLLFKVKRIEVKSGISSLIEFSRPLSDGGHMLKTIAENKVVTMIYAWNPNSKIITYHTAGNRGSMKMDFFSNRNIDNMSVIKRKNLLFHGITMFLVWTVLYPISIWKVRYRKTKSSYAKNHRFLQMLGAVFVAISGGVALAMLGENPIRTVHGKIGISIICVISLQFILGFFNMWSLGNVESVNMGIIRLLRHIHVIFGAILLILSWVNINFGINEHSKQFGTYNWSIIALTWMGLILFIFIMSENIFRIRDMRFRYSKKPDTDRKPTQQLRYFIKDYDQLPILSLDEFNQRVVRGMKLVLVENMIFDIGKWIGVHPGGAKILQRVVGTDITHDFFGDNNNFSNDVKMKFKIDGDEFHNPEPDHKNEGENQVVITRRSNSKNEGVSESLANLIDVININKTLGKKSSRVSVHSHSKYATEKLATMIIAKLPELSDIYDEDKKFNNMGNSNQHVGYNNQPSLTSQNQHYTSQYNQPSPQIDPPDLSSPNIFRRCIITNIEVVTDNYQSNNSSIVKKFTLKTVHEDDNFPHRRFLPGDYIEIMCEIDQQRFIRQYSPLLQEFNEDYRRNDSNIETGKSNIFWILAKIYKNGPMSKYLDKQLKNFEVLVRGPFNLSDNVNLSDQPSPISDCILLNSNKPNGCWNNLFMICGGSGVTPMLQLIHYHLQYQLQRKSADTFYLYLLFANNSYSDIIYKKHLDYLVKKFKGSLSITHILVNPPDNWDGLKGHIDEVILFNWLSNNINIKPCDVNTTNVPTPKQVVYYPQQQQQFASGDDYTTPLIMPYSPSEQRQLYSTQDLLAESSSSYSSHSTIDKFPDDSKVVICGNDGFMLSIQNICNKIGIKEKDTLFLI